MTDTEINEAVARKLGTMPECHCTDALHKSEARHFIPDYCHSIATAWEIVEKSDYCYLFYSKDILKGWECKLTRTDKREFYGEADTAPMSICLAFLKLLSSEAKCRSR